MKINICMLFELRYDPRMLVVPHIGVVSYITNFGHDVTWVLPSGGAKEVRKETLDGISVFAVPYRSREGILEYVSKTVYALRRARFVAGLFKQERYNIVFAGDCIFDALLALYIKRRYNVPFVLELGNPVEQDFEFHKVYHPNHKHLWHLISKINVYLLMHALRNADLVLPISKWLKEDFIKKGIGASKILPLPEGMDADRFSDADGNTIRREYNLDGSGVVVYVGTIDKMRHLDTLIHAISEVKKRGSGVKLLMVGDGDDKTDLERLACELGISDDVVFTGQVYSDEVPNFIAAADIGVSPVPPFDFYKFSSPIKLFEYMAVRKPVVANKEIPEHEEVIRKSGCGVLVQFTGESFAEGIIKLLDDPEMAEEMGEKGYKWGVMNRSYETTARGVEKRCLGLLKSMI